ncbi:MAG TPA: LysR substrate-binding domain-containing protein [Burkholderiales bacterium]|jgi:DNA-binding transcriptional LysR family regulator|nr:LysR substrate-binding domain-containing protein [Burkholderiales bacterium]
MLPDLVSLALFVRVAETRSITKAAQAAHIALAAASRRISLLEHQYGVKLLERTARGVELTPAGRALVHRARLMLSQADQLRAELDEHASGGRGHVRLQASESAISQFLPEDLASFSAIAPQAAIALEERFSGEIVQALREGATDIGVIMEGTPTEGLQCFDYRTDQLVAVVPRKHPLRSRQVMFSALLDHEFVALESATAITRLLIDQAAVARKPLRARIQVHSFAALCKMIEAGLGVGVLPEGAAKPFAAAKQLRLVPLGDAWARRRMFICVRSYGALPAIARRLVDHLQRTN